MLMCICSLPIKHPQMLFNVILVNQSHESEVVLVCVKSKAFLVVNLDLKLDSDEPDDTFQVICPRQH